MTKNYCFLGIGGASMSALAKYLISEGHTVFGYDAVSSRRTEELESMGVKIYFSQMPDEEEKAAINGADEIVYTSAISAGNARFDECAAQGKKMTSRGEFLGRIARDFSEVIAIGGSHGKTTCTAMCAHIFRAANEAFTAHIGGDDSEFENFCSFGKKYLITEACEYKKNLLKLRPTLSVLLNIDRDHLECYGGIEGLTAAFVQYCKTGTRGAIVCADDEKTRLARLTLPYPSFGIENAGAYYSAKNLNAKDEKYSFDFYEGGKKLCRVSLNVEGKCHVYNALAAGAAARFFGLSAEAVKNGLFSFRGVKRRFERLGMRGGAVWYADYAHHPREIASTLFTARAMAKSQGKRLLTIFQPHTYSRTKNLFSEFVSVLSSIKDLLIFKTYAARETYSEEGSAKTLCDAIGNAAYAETDEALKDWIDAHAEDGDFVLFLGAGDIYDRAERILSDRPETQNRKNGNTKT